jgi:hypothetical protein
MCYFCCCCFSLDLPSEVFYSEAALLFQPRRYVVECIPCLAAAIACLVFRPTKRTTNPIAGYPKNGAIRSRNGVLRSPFERCLERRSSRRPGPCLESQRRLARGILRAGRRLRVSRWGQKVRGLPGQGGTFPSMQQRGSSRWVGCVALRESWRRWKSDRCCSKLEPHKRVAGQYLVGLG